MRVIILPFILSFAPLLVLAQNDVDDLPVKTMDIMFDNDLFPNGSDNDYTTGLKFRLMTEALNWEVPGLLKFKSRFKEEQPLPSHLFNSRKKEYNFTYNGFEVGLVYFTPDSLTSDRVILTQRPFASLQYFRLSLVSMSKIRDWRLHNGSHYRELNTAITIGLTGGPAAESLQRWMHEQLLKKPHIVPVGWPNQIGKTKNIVIANYLIDYSQLLNNSLLIPLKSKHSIYNKSIYNVFQWYNLHGGIRLNIGTMMNDVSFYFPINFLNVNRQYEYYIDFFREGFSDIPHGTVDPMRQKPSWSIPENNYLHGLSDELERQIDAWRDLNDGEYHRAIEQAIQERELALDQIANDTESHDKTVDELHQLIQISRRMKTCKAYREFYRDGSKKYFRNHSFKIFILPLLRYVAHNGFLQGPLLYNNAQDHTIRYIQPWVFQLELGLNWKIGAVELEYKPYIFRTKEYPKQAPKNAEGVIPRLEEASALIVPQTWHSWSSLMIRINPGMIYDRIKS